MYVVSYQSRSGLVGPRRSKDDWLWLANASNRGKEKAADTGDNYREATLFVWVTNHMSVLGNMGTPSAPCRTRC